MPRAGSIPAGPSPSLASTVSRTVPEHGRPALTASDVAWICALLLVTGIATRLGLDKGERVGWLVLDAVVVWTALRRPGLGAMISRHRLLMSWALLAIVSAAWSLAPFVSVYHGLQLAMTIMAGFLFAASVGLSRLVWLVFLTLYLAALLSLGFNIAVPDLSTGWQGAWMGAFDHKNTLGSMMALLVVTSLVLMAGGERPLLAWSGILLGSGLLVMSRSGTALLSLFVALAAFLPFTFLRIRQVVLPASAGMALIAAAATAFYFAVSGSDPGALVLDAMGKDPTLTGRRLLWDFGTEAFHRRPWLGHGFKGFWEGDPSAALLLRFAIGEELWLFHNNAIEVAVAFGIPGLVLFAVAVAQTLARALRTALRASSAEATWPLALVLLTLPQCLTENPLYYNHGVLQLLFAAAAAASGMDARRPPDRRM